MRPCSKGVCAVILAEKDIWLGINGKEVISLKANHMVLVACDNNVINFSSLSNASVVHISHDITKGYLRFLSKDFSQIPLWQRNVSPVVTVACLTPDVFRVIA